MSTILGSAITAESRIRGDAHIHKIKNCHHVSLLRAASPLVALMPCLPRAAGSLYALGRSSPMGVPCHQPAWDGMIRPARHAAATPGS